MPHLRQVGQGHSAECGFFSAYALKLVHDHPGAAEAWEMDAGTVREARHDFLTRAGLATGQSFESYQTILRFLEDLGAGSYTFRPNISARTAHTAERFISNINAWLGRDRGVMLLYEGSGYRHYFDILPGAPRGRRQRDGSRPDQWYFYDPAAHVNPHFGIVPCLDFANFHMAGNFPIWNHVTAILARSG